jgi:gas vesicle protein
MTFLRNRLFVGGILFGGVCGIIIGSVIAFTLGESSASALRRLLQERSRGRVPVEYLSQ